MQIEKIPLSQLVPDDHNARRHDERNIAEVKKSLQQFGQHRAFVVQRGSNKILVGNGMYEAMRQLGWEEADVYFVDDDDATAVRRALADNRTAELAEWDTDVLAHLFDNFRGGADIPGWSEDEIDKILQLAEGAAGKEAVEDEPPEPPEKAVTKPGDVWLLGEHRLICGDSTSASDMETLMAGSVADLVLTDPPYNVDYTGKTKDKLKIKNDIMKKTEFEQFLMNAFSTFLSVLKPGGSVYIWHADSEGLAFRSALEECGVPVRECLIWVKNAFVLGRQDYQWKHEPCLYGWTAGAAHTWLGDRKQSTVLEFDRPQRNADHPTMKPVKLFAYLIGNSCRREEIVLDPFGGSGTSLIACEQLGRRCRMVELDPRYCDVIVRRWQALTGADAILERTGKAFDSMT